MITVKDLEQFVKEKLKNKKIIVAVQAEPYQHIKDNKDRIVMQKQAGGVHLLLDALLKHTGGTVIAIARGNADAEVVDEKGKIEIKTDKKNYILKRIFLDKEEFDNFYFGFSNQTLWPLCHAVFQQPVFEPKWWSAYISVNKKYYKAIKEEIKDDDAFIWINDYQLALLPRMLQQVKPKLAIGTFWHIPWPTYEIFRICPWRKPIMDGLLGSDFISFHRDYQVENFIDCAGRDLGVIVETEPKSVRYYNHKTHLLNLPAGIDYDEIEANIKKSKQINYSLIKKEFGVDFSHLMIGVERIDYTKGLIERIKIIDRFFELYPEFKNKLVYLSISPRSRFKIPAYRNYYNELMKLKDEINDKYSSGRWEPIIFFEQKIDRQKLFKYYRLADACIVTSLDDGMNLVAKEYIMSSDPKKAALLLSKFTGAAKDLRQAILINPYDIDGSARAMYQALNLSEAEKIKRNSEMKNIIKENNIYQWAIQFMQNTLNANAEGNIY